jgi:hypothetical protein
MTTPTPTSIDREALQRSLDLVTAGTDHAAERIRYKLAHDGWHEAAKSAAAFLQVKNLHLQIWQRPPCAIPQSRADQQVLQIRKRLKQLGLSLYEPDPAHAIANAEKKEVTK